jgi:uncharacterized protein (DUF952 family)/GNAT superfamily N-acetyltransferase
VLLHIISRHELAEAQSSGEIAPSSLDAEGFAHCSYPEQVLIPANERFQHREDLVLVVLAPERILPSVVVEDSYGSGMSFPHVYGPIPVAAIERVVEFPCQADGTFVLPRVVRSEVCSVRECTSGESAIRVDYFHAATETELDTMGVDPRLLPEPNQWLRDLENDLARPPEDRDSFSILWVLGDKVIGFATANQMEVGKRAFMHLHIVDRSYRGKGLGARFVRLSASHFFNALQLQRLYSEPRALNIAPNRTLQAAGFNYQFSHHVTPGPINAPQITTRWVLER